jgi:long-chain acyl-CoA synthetase
MSSTSPNGSGERRNAANGDWLYALIAEIAGEHPTGGDELRLNEDFHLDSLGRVQLSAALEERLADAPQEGAVDAARTLGDLRQLIGRVSQETATTRREVAEIRASSSLLPVQPPEPEHTAATAALSAGTQTEPVKELTPAAVTQQAQKAEFVYPHWPWWKPMQWIRSAFLEGIAQPLVWFLGHPRVTAPRNLLSDEPMLIICNHVTAYDGALVEYALPGKMRRWVASAMLGEMLEDFRHFRNPDTRRFMLFGPAAYWLVTAFYNVFPLPRRKDFQRSFAHAGEALDRGYTCWFFRRARVRLSGSWHRSGRESGCW